MCGGGGLGVDVVGVDAVRDDAVERKHTTWHGIKKKTKDKTQKHDSKKKKKKIVTYQDITRLTSPYTRFPL